MVVRKAERRPVPKGQLPAFAPVPRKQPRHDGWTPERQRAFIEALADTGCVAIACRMVNMSQPSFYQLRRQPGAESFRAAADAAQTLGLQPVKDEAFERATTGELIPVFVAGKLMGFRRKKNDRLLMFILRHYGEDGAGRRTTINYFSTRATAGAGATTTPLPSAGSGSPLALSGGQGCGPDGEPRSGEGEGLPTTTPADQSAIALAKAEATTTTVKTVISGSPAPSPLSRDTDAADLINAFEGVPLDPEAQAEIQRTLAACAERRRALEDRPEHDPDRLYIGAAETNGYLGQLESGVEGDWVEYKPDGEHRWESLGEGGQPAEIDRAVAEMQARLATESPDERAAREAAEDAMSRAQYEEANRPLPAYLGGGNLALPAPEPDADDPRLDWRNWQTGAYTPPPETPSPSMGEGWGGGGPSKEPTPEPPVPSPGAPKRAYKKRTPKPRFTPPDRVRKAEAIAEVAAERRVNAAAETGRRERRKRSSGDSCS